MFTAADLGKSLTQTAEAFVIHAERARWLVRIKNRKRPQQGVRIVRITAYREKLPGSHFRKGVLICSVSK